MRIGGWMAGVCVAGLAGVAMAAPAPLKVSVDGITDGKPIPPSEAYCIATAKEKSGEGLNDRPGILWSAGPHGTRSYAVVMVDPDVPTDFTDAGKEGKTIPESMKRQDFYHWVQIDIPLNVTSLAVGKGRGEGKEQAAHGKPAINSYAKFMGAERKAEFVGYDGSCPPWNDERLHHYHFKALALDIAKLPVKDGFTAEEAVEAMEGHVLAQGEVVGTYTLNPALSAPAK